MKNFTSIFLVFALMFSSCSKDNDAIDPKPVVPTDTIPKVVTPPEVNWSSKVAYPYQLERDSVWADKKGHTFFVNTSKVFLTNQLQSDIFIGAIFDRKTDFYNNPKTIESYRFNPQEILSLPFKDDQQFSDYIPSRKNYEPIESYYLGFENKQNLSSMYSEGHEFDSYKGLYMMFASLGISADSVVSGKRYWDKAMSKKYGNAILSEVVRFKITMNYPHSLVEKPDDYYIRNAFYISSISYGAYKALISESDEKAKDVKAIIKKISRGDVLTSGEKTIIDKTEIYILNLNTSSVERNVNKEELIKKFYSAENMKLTYPMWLYMDNPTDVGMQVYTHRTKLHLP